MAGRNLSIDLVKVVAMLEVICLHTTHNFMVKGEFAFADVLYETAVVAMPLFFMVSGYLMLGRKDLNYKYVCRKIFNILKFVFIICTFFWLLHSIHHLDFNFILLAKSFLNAFLQKGQFALFWYFGAIILIYAFLPLLNTLFLSYRKIFLSVMSMLLLVQSSAFISNLLGGVNEVSICQTFRLWNWLLYFCLGGLLKGKKFSSFPAILLFMLIVWNIVIEEWLNPYIGNEYCEYFYSSLYVVFLSVGIFIFILNHRIRHKRFITFLSPLFLPVYALHSFVIGYTYCFFDGFNPNIGAPLFWIFVSFVTISISAILMKIPFVKTIFKI